MTLEGLLRSPWDAMEPPPLRFDSLLQRLETVASLNDQLSALERVGLALYSAASTHFVKVPYYTDEGMTTGSRQSAEYATGARLMIAEFESDRLRITADAVWPLGEELDQVPF